MWWFILKPVRSHAAECGMSWGFNKNGTGEASGKRHKNGTGLDEGSPGLKGSGGLERAVFAQTLLFLPWWMHISNSHQKEKPGSDRSHQDSLDSEFLHEIIKGSKLQKGDRMNGNENSSNIISSWNLAEEKWHVSLLKHYRTWQQSSHTFLWVLLSSKLYWTIATENP